MRFSELDGARVGVWGAGREIASLARQLLRRLPGTQITAAVFDTPPPGDVLATLGFPHALLLDAEQAPALLEHCDVLVRSPGVSIHRPQMLALLQAGLTVTTATSLWLCERGGEGVIGVTGTKGKSTTAALIAQLARAGGHTVALAGNIGAPALELLDREPAQVTVLELSSYQIADLACGPEVAVLTNLYREHTDWHGSEQAYRVEKLRLFALDGVRRAVAAAGDVQLLPLGSEVETIAYDTPAGWQADAEGISLAGRRMLERAQLPLAGAHNALNLCAALSALQALDVELSSPLADALSGFQTLPHRLQPVGEHGGVSWVDDSISTTPESALAALASFPARAIVLIAGGQDRGQDYAALARALADSGACVIGVPSTGPRLIAAARAAGVPAERAVEAVDLAQAVELARALAPAGAVVLLSPAAPSYDHHRDFEQRGERFRALVEGLGGVEGAPVR